MSETEETFASKLMDLLGGKYSPAMRRSVQTVVLYEANRCLKDRYSSLRPFQRKIALYDTASDIINTLGFIPPYHRIEIMFRTASGKVPLSPDLAWRRMKLIDREIQKTIVPKIRPFLGDPGRTHKECCDDFIQSQYETVSGIKGKRHPVVWEYSHLNIFLAYRMFYAGEDVDPDLPAARDPNPNRVVPNKKPAVYPPDPTMGGKGGSDYDSDGSSPLKSFADEIAGGEGGAGGAGGAHPGGGGKKRGRKGRKGDMDPDVRRAMLKEVRDHLEILREFEGVIPADELNKRKRELFMSLPPAPTGKGGAGKKKGGVSAVPKAETPPAAPAAKGDGGDQEEAEGDEGESPTAKKAKTATDEDAEEEEKDEEEEDAELQKQFV